VKEGRYDFWGSRCQNAGEGRPQGERAAAPVLRGRSQKETAAGRGKCDEEKKKRLVFS